MSLLEGLFVGRRPSEALDRAQNALEYRAEAVAFAGKVDAATGRELIDQLREAVTAVHVARERVIRDLTRPPDL